MNGVEILLMTEVATEFTCNRWVVWITFIIFIIGGTIIGYFSHKKCDVVEKFLYTVLFGLTGALFGMLAWLIVVALTTTPTSYETQYKVTIDDSVSMNEFMDNYEILDQEGKIYTVREKD